MTRDRVGIVESEVERGWDGPVSDTTAPIRHPEAEARGYIESLLPTVRVAGSPARARFRSDLKLTGKAHGDVVTDVDLACESAILDGIAAIGPTHRIHSEEAGRTAGNSDWEWIVAPLDGTHNYVSSIPLFGVIVTLCFSRTSRLPRSCMTPTRKKACTERGWGLSTSRAPNCRRLSPERRWGRRQ